MPRKVTFCEEWVDERVRHEASLTSMLQMQLVGLVHIFMIVIRHGSDEADRPGQTLRLCGAILRQKRRSRQGHWTPVFEMS